MYYAQTWIQVKACTSGSTMSEIESSRSTIATPILDNTTSRAVEGLNKNSSGDLEDLVSACSLLFLACVPGYMHAGLASA